MERPFQDEIDEYYRQEIQVKMDVNADVVPAKQEKLPKTQPKRVRRLCTRHNWRYMGVCERGGETNRLHFHALVRVP